MWSDYYFYLMTLPEAERTKQIIIMICFWFILLSFGVIFDYIENFKNKKF